MKKTLVALATLSAIGSAFADVDVSNGIKLYGVLDQAVTTQELVNPTTTSTAPGTPTLRYTSLFASSATSRFGVKGSRDLGDDVKGFVQIELQVEPDNLSVLNYNKNRQAFVGLTSPKVGTLSMGTMETTAYEIFGMDVNGRVEYKPQVWRTTTSSDTQDRANNSLKFISPDLFGFNIHAQYGFSDKRVGATPFAGLGAKYHEGNLRGAFVYDRIENSAATYRFAGIINAGPSKEGVDASAQGGTAGSTPTGQSTTSQTYAGDASKNTTVKRQIGALTYDFGSFSTNYLFAKSYVTDTYAGSNTTNTFGIKVPYEKFVFALSYGTGSVSSYKTSGTGAYILGTANTKDRTLGVYYNIDKSTNIYLLSSNSSIIGTVGGAAANQDGRNTTTAVGARYNF
jgi:predicted porin